MQYATITSFLATAFTLAPAVLGAPTTVNPGHTNDVSQTDCDFVTYCASNTTATFGTAGEPDTGGIGIMVHNADSVEGNFFLHENCRDMHPWKYITLPPNGSGFLQVCPSFQGRLIRGVPAIETDGRSHMRGTTLVEISWASGTSSTGALGDGSVSGDVSLYVGYDGAATLEATDTIGYTTGFTKDILPGAPADLLITKDSGSKAIIGTAGGVVPDATTYERASIDPKLTYVGSDDWYFPLNATGVQQPVTQSTNGRVKVTFYKGSY